MNKRLLAVVVLGLMVAVASFGQISLGVTGALRMDTDMTAEEITAAFQEGQNIYYGPFAEIILGKLGFGVQGNFSFFQDYDYTWNEYVEYMDYDITAYVAYHLFGGRAFLDPIVEFGAGMIAQDYADEMYDNDLESPFAANLYWYAAAGLGVNLGPIGVFGKLAYNNIIDEAVTDSYGNDVPYYGTWTDDGFGNWTFEPYLPKFRFTLGAKINL